MKRTTVFFAACQGNDDWAFDNESTLSLQVRVRFLSFQAKTKGWFSIIAWAHRLSGLLMVGVMWWHILSVSTTIPEGPEKLPYKMLGCGWALFLVWCFAIPMIFHGLNGGRLMLYESFGCRRDSTLICWVFGISAVYLIVLALVRILGDQVVSPPLFWAASLSLACTLAFGMWRRFRFVPHSLLWKLQRTIGAFLLGALPASVLFIQLRAHSGPSVDILIPAVQNGFIRATIILTVLAALYHGGYGTFSVIRDYTSSKGLERASVAFLIVTSVLLAFLGIRAVFTI